MTAFTSAEHAALRAVEPPPLSLDFTDRVMARLNDPRDPSTALRAPRGDRRGRWRRTGIVLMSGVVAGLLSVGAAASGLLGTSIQSLPVVSFVVQKLTPKRPKPLKIAHKTAKLVPVKTVVVAQAAVPPPASDAASASDPSPLPLRPRIVRREARVERIAARIERRAERRRLLGLPTKPRAPEAKVRLRNQLRQLPPQERRALWQRVRELRRERRMMQGFEPTPVLPAPVDAPQPISGGGVTQTP